LDYQKALTELRGTETALRLFQAAARQPAGPAVGVPVIAPISGIVVERPVNRGEMVAPSTTMFMLIDVGTVWLEGDVFESDVARVKIGQPVRVIAAAFPNKIFSGSITYIDATVNPESRTVKVRTEVANRSPDLLRPDMFASGQIVLGKLSAVVTIPKDAVLDDGGLKIVFVKKGGAYQRRIVRAGVETLDRIEIKDGVDAGEQVVVQGAYELKAAAAKGR